MTTIEAIRLAGVGGSTATPPHHDPDPPPFPRMKDRMKDRLKDRLNGRADDADLPPHYRDRLRPRPKAVEESHDD